MRKSLIFIYANFVCFFSIGQEVDSIFFDEKTYHVGSLLDSIKHGEWKSYKNGILEERVFYSFGVKDGEALKFYENGIVKIRAFYLNDLLNGNVLFYSEYGNLIANFFFVDGIFDGNWYYIDDENSPPTFKTYRPEFSLK